VNILTVTGKICNWKFISILFIPFGSGNARTNLTLRRVPVTIVAVEKQ